MDPIALVTVIAGGLFGGGGLATALVMLFKVRTENRKTSADAAAVLSGSAATFAQEVRADAAVARADAAAARERADRSARESAHLRGVVEGLHARVLAIDTCRGGAPCPLRQPPRVLDAVNPSDPPVVVVDTGG